MEDSQMNYRWIEARAFVLPAFLLCLAESAWAKCDQEDGAPGLRRPGDRSEAKHWTRARMSAAI
jgi:hypothetical protein